MILLRKQATPRINQIYNNQIFVEDIGYAICALWGW
jgi:hypothetical protein